MSRVFLNAINLFSSNSSEKPTRSTDVFTNSIFMSDFYCVNNEYLPSFVQEYEDTSPGNLYNDAPSVPPPPTVSEKEFAHSTCMPKLETFKRDNGVKEITLDNGLKINATIYTKLKGVQSEWLDQLKYMQQAADELGLVLVFGELSRTVEISNTGNQNKGSVVAKAYGKSMISERHRHRYEVNNEYIKQISDAGLVFSGMSPDGMLAEVVELPKNDWFVASQFHPEFKSRPNNPHPLFKGLIDAAVKRV